MDPLQNTVKHIKETAKIPSFSSYEERLHPYIQSVFRSIPGSSQVNAPGNNLIYRVGSEKAVPAIALTAHLDKINHYGEQYPPELPVRIDEEQIAGAMDDAVGVGILLALAETAAKEDFPDLLFFFSEMEESKGLKEHPHLLKSGGSGYQSGMGARNIADTCASEALFPRLVITVDTTPLFRGRPGVALYARHWEYSGSEPSEDLQQATEQVVEEFLALDPAIRVDNNTNDYLHYGAVFNRACHRPVVSVALEPAIFPYHQKGEKVYIKDIKRVLELLTTYIDDKGGE